jgi:hypothetical protein
MVRIDVSVIVIVIVIQYASYSMPCPPSEYIINRSEIDPSENVQLKNTNTYYCSSITNTRTKPEAFRLPKIDKSQ